MRETPTGEDLEQAHGRAGSKPTAESERMAGNQQSGLTEHLEKGIWKTERKESS